MKNYLSQKDSVHNKSRIARKGLMLLFVAVLTFGSSAPAISSTTYAVPAGGLSFDANGALEENDPCSEGFGNSFGFAELDEVNGLVAGEFLTYSNVATIDGQAINARVTLTSISGMRTEGSSTVLDRLDKCDMDSNTGLVELNFDSETNSPGDAHFVLTIDFLANGTPVTLTNLKMNVEDIDNNQYLEIDNFTSALLASGRDADNVQEYDNGDVIAVGSGLSSSAISTTATARRFHALGSEDGNGAAETDKHVVEVTYASVSSLVLKLGVYESGGGSFDLNFKGFTFTAPTETVTSTPPSAPSTAPAVRTLATTGVSEQLTLGILGLAAVLLIGLGAFLTRMRRKLS
jgi:LPXTG-motif cell wall-anchored protein